MQNSFTALNNLYDQATKTMMLPVHDMSPWLFIILDVGGGGALKRICIQMTK